MTAHDPGLFLSWDYEGQPSSQPSPTILEATFSRDELVQALSAVQVALGDGDLGWIQLEFAEDQTVIISAQNPTLAVRYALKASHSQKGVLKVSGRQLLEYTKQIPQNTLSFHAELPYRVLLSSGHSSAKLHLIQGHTSTHVQAAPSDSEVRIKGTTLAPWATSFKDLLQVDDTRFYANGALIWVEDNCLCAVASDAVRLAHVKLNDGIQVQSAQGGRILVPRKTWEEIIRMSGQHPEDEFCLKWSEGTLSFSIESPQYLLHSKTIAGLYPPYENAIPHKLTTKIQLSVATLAESIKRALIFADKSKVLQLAFDQNTLRLSCFTPGQKEGEEVIALDAAVESPFDVNYNGAHLASILSVLPAGQVELHWESINRPVKITGAVRPGLEAFYLLVPTKF